MSYQRSCILITLTALLLCLQANASDIPAAKRIDPADLQKIMLVKDIKPGMKGYGKSVFRGTKPETFQVEVLGVLKKVNYGADLILVKLSGGPMTKRGANLIEGMSGSPIYINNKLIGAFSMGEIFGKEPIGMVTPIECMLEAWDKSLPSKPSSFYPFSTSTLDEPIMLGGKKFSKIAIDSGMGGQLSQDRDALVFRPLPIPVLVSSMSPRIMSYLQENLKPLNIRTVAGPGIASDKANLNIDIQPGSAIGMSLVTGDIDISGIGTATYRRGNKILAFGHPMTEFGSIDAPLTTAYVYDVFPSYYVSSKIAMPVKPIGRIFQDRPWSVAGEIGKASSMIPVTVHVNQQSLGRKRVFRANVINHPLLSKMLIAPVAAEGIYELTDMPTTDLTAKVKFQVVADEVGIITRENTYFDPMSIDFAAVSELEQILTLLQFNPFNPVDVKSVDLWVDVTPNHQTAKLDRIFLKESKFEPGDTVEVSAVLKPFKGEKTIESIKLQLPKNMPNGSMSLQVLGGAMSYMAAGPEEGSGSAYSMMAGPPGAGQPIMPSIENLPQLINKFLERNKSNELVARIVLPKPLLSIAGEKLSGLPQSIADAMRSPKATALGSERDEIKAVLPTDWVITGAQRLTISVQKTDKSEKKSSKKPSEPSVDEPAESESEDSSSPPDEEAPEDMRDSELGLNTSSGSRFEISAADESSPIKPEDTKAVSAGQDVSAAADEKPADAKETKNNTYSSVEEKPIGRAPGIWKQTTKSDFQAGTLKNTAATTGDLLTLAGSLQAFCETTETYIWSMLPDGKGNIYAGTGNHGIIYKIAADGTSSVLYDSPELEIHSLAQDPAGNLYAGTSPNGIVYKIAPDGTASTLLDADEKYITALALDSKNNIYAATGDKCKVYRISPEGKADVVLDSSENHVLSLAVDKNDDVYVGTGLNGIVYKITSAGDVSILYDAAENSVTALAVDSNGVLFAGTSPKGAVYKLAPDATPKAIYDKAGQGIVGISVDVSGNIYAANAANVSKIMPDETVCTLENEHDLQFLSLALDGDRLYMGTGNIGSVYSADIRKAIEGTYESTIHDCGLTSNWGVADWTADIPQGASIVLQARTGNVAEPDSTWSGWSAPYTPGSKIASPPGRYIQYLATLKTDDISKNPKLKDVSIVYMAKNQAPKVTLTNPKGGEKWARKKTIKWTCSDPDKDKLTYDLFCSADNGVTWQPLRDKIETTSPEKNEKPQGNEPPAAEETSTEEEATKPTPPDPQEMLAEMSAELDSHPEIPQDVKDRIMSEATTEMQNRPADQEAGSVEAPVPENPAPEEKPTANGTGKTSFSWDTSKFKDGTYLIKIVGSDRLSNPTDALTDEVISESIIVTNKAPKVVTFKKTLTVKADLSALVEGVAFQSLVGIAGVQYKVGSNDWAAAAASDGIFDTDMEAFTVTTQPLEKGDQTIEIKAIDQAGNAATTKVQVKIE